ncbi:hypothetical protein tb265_17600 [Gemmatimonadetes bacterium T265]|nr:hypothetical protein tb265_17600 [Gemmatimonadetes bacterium T265]
MPPAVHAQELFRAARLDAAIEALGGELRERPSDARGRTFLFELLAFAGQYDRAARQLDVLGAAGPGAEGGALLYKSALHAERERRELFERGGVPAAADGGAEAEGAVASDGPGLTSDAPTGGTLNGRRFASIADADPRIGARLELYAAGRYLLLPFVHVASVRLEPPQRLRDLLWAPAVVRTGPRFRGRELGEVLLPVMTPLASAHPHDEVRLGRVTEWVALDAPAGGEAPVGQKLLLVDGDEVPLLEVRELVIDAPDVPAVRHAAPQAA